MRVDLSSFSKTQKSVLAVASIFLILSVFIHNPFSGYIIDTGKTFYKTLETSHPCTQIEKKRHRHLLNTVRKMDLKDYEKTTFTQEYIDASVDTCRESDKEPYKEIAPISDWRSQKPIVHWFGYISNMFQLFLVVSLVGLAINYIFKDHNSK